MSDLRPERWHGDPEEEVQPDVGDVLAYVDADGMFCGPIMLVRHARPVRRREHEPHELMLLLEEGHVGHLYGKDGAGRVFSATRRRHRRKA